MMKIDVYIAFAAISLIGIMGQAKPGDYRPYKGMPDGMALTSRACSERGVLGPNTVQINDGEIRKSCGDDNYQKITKMVDRLALLNFQTKLKKTYLAATLRVFEERALLDSALNKNHSKAEVTDFTSKVGSTCSEFSKMHLDRKILEANKRSEVLAAKLTAADKETLAKRVVAAFVAYNLILESPNYKKNPKLVAELDKLKSLYPQLMVREDSADFSKGFIYRNYETNAYTAVELGKSLSSQMANEGVLKSLDPLLFPTTDTERRTLVPVKGRSEHGTVADLFSKLNAVKLDASSAAYVGKATEDSYKATLKSFKLICEKFKCDGHSRDCNTKTCELAALRPEITNGAIEEEPNSVMQNGFIRGLCRYCAKDDTKLSALLKKSAKESFDVVQPLAAMATCVGSIVPVLTPFAAGPCTALTAAGAAKDVLELPEAYNNRENLRALAISSLVADSEANAAEEKFNSLVTSTVMNTVGLGVGVAPQKVARIRDGLKELVAEGKITKAEAEILATDKRGLDLAEQLGGCLGSVAP